MKLFTNKNDLLQEKYCTRENQVKANVNKRKFNNMSLNKFRISLDASKIDCNESSKENVQKNCIIKTDLLTFIPQLNNAYLLKDYMLPPTHAKSELSAKTKQLNEINGDVLLNSHNTFSNTSPMSNKEAMVMSNSKSLNFFGKQQYASLNVEINYSKIVSPSIMNEEECAFEHEKTPINSNSQDTEIKDMNSAETLKEGLEDTNSSSERNVKCLVVPTFREKQWLSLNDYIKGHDQGFFSQMNIINQANGDPFQKKNLLNCSKLMFERSDFRHPSFFIEETTTNKNTCSDSNDESDLYKISNDVHDIKTIKDSIKSIGFETNDHFSKLKFNLLSEVFYYNDTAASKIKNKLSLMEAAKAALHDEEDSSHKCSGAISFSEPSCNSYNTPANSTTYDSCLLLVNVSKLRVFGKLEAEKNQESLHAIVYNKNTKLSGIFNMRKLLFENEKYSKNSEINFEFKTQESETSDLDGCLADIESLGSNELSFSFIQNDSCENAINSSLKKDLKANTAISKDMTITANIKPILKQRYNKNELIESKIADIESSEQIDLFFNKFEAKEEMRLRMEPKLSQIRALQLKKFYSKDFYPNMQEDEEFLRSVRATQNKIGFSIFSE